MHVSARLCRTHYQASHLTGGSPNHGVCPLNIDLSSRPSFFDSPMSKLHLQADIVAPPTTIATAVFEILSSSSSTSALSYPYLEFEVEAR